MSERMFDADYCYTVTEYDAEHPWVVIGIGHGRVTLPDDASVYAWARENWPAPWWSVELDPLAAVAGPRQRDRVKRSSREP